VLSPGLIYVGFPLAEYTMESVPIFTECVTLHPAESVTVTVYIPGDKPETLAVVSPPGVHK